MERTRACFFALSLLLLISCKSSMRDLSPSMEPTIKKGESVVVDKTAFVSSSPARWDIVAYVSQRNGVDWMLHRVVGLPGEIIDIRDSSIYINGAKQALPPNMVGIGYINGGSRITYPFTITKDFYFVLGDNPGESEDSRYMGPIPAKSLRGKVVQ